MNESIREKRKTSFKRTDDKFTLDLAETCDAGSNQKLAPWVPRHGASSALWLCPRELISVSV